MNLLTLTSNEAQRIAYAQGDDDIAELFARIADLQQERKELQNRVCELESRLADMGVRL